MATMLVLDPAVRAKLLAMSAATIDRRLAGDRRRFQIKGRTGTKPGTLLKGQIPIRTFSDWDDTRGGSHKRTWSPIAATPRSESSARPSP